MIDVSSGDPHRARMAPISFVCQVGVFYFTLCVCLPAVPVFMPTYDHNDSYKLSWICACQKLFVLSGLGAVCVPWAPQREKPSSGCQAQGGEACGEWMKSFDTDLGHGISLTATSGWSIHFRFIPGYTTNQEKHHWGEVVEGVHTQKTSPSLVVLRKLCQCDGSASLSSILILSSGTLLCCVLIVLFSVGFCWFYTWWPVEMGRLGQACWPQRHSHM